MYISNKTIFTAGTFLILIIVLLSLMRTAQKSADTDYAALTSDLDPEAYIDYDYTEVTTDVIRRKIRNKPDSVKLVDVRPANEFARQHIVGSVNIPLDDLIKGNVAPRYNVDMVVVVFDELNAGLISQAIKIFEKQNDYVVALSGGISTWNAVNPPLLSAGDPQSVVDAAKISYVTPEELDDIIAAKQAGTNRRDIILDIRPRAQFERGHIPYAINIPLPDLERTYDSLPATKRIIVYGETSIDSFRGGVQLYDLNFLTAQTLNSGYIDWIRSNRDVQQ